MIPLGREFYKMSGSGNDFVFVDTREMPAGPLTSPEVVGAIGTLPQTDCDDGDLCTEDICVVATDEFAEMSRQRTDLVGRVDVALEQGHAAEAEEKEIRKARVSRAFSTFRINLTESQLEE